MGVVGVVATAGQDDGDDDDGGGAAASTLPLLPFPWPRGIRKDSEMIRNGAGALCGWAGSTPVGKPRLAGCG